LALLLYTGQRRSDVVTMGKQHIDKDGAIHLCQIKTGKLGKRNALDEAKLRGQQTLKSYLAELHAHLEEQRAVTQARSAAEAAAARERSPDRQASIERRRSLVGVR
jgi:integrase